MPTLQGLRLTNNFSIFLKFNVEENYIKKTPWQGIFNIHTVYVVYEWEADFWIIQW